MSLVDVIADVNALVDRHGYDLVHGALVFIGTYGDHLNVTVGDAKQDLYFTISKNQFRDIGVLARAGDKIAAIKMLRDIVGCGLKEAKDVVENQRW